MKTLRTQLTLCLLCLTSLVFAQSPQVVPYKGEALDNFLNPLPLQSIGLRFSLHSGAANGIVVYIESQTTVTDALGKYSVKVGTGTADYGTFGTIDWSVDKYLEVELDINGGTNYANMGTELISVVNVTAYLEGWFRPGTPYHGIPMLPTLWTLWDYSSIGNSTTDFTATDSVKLSLWAYNHLSNPEPDFSECAILHSNGVVSAAFTGVGTSPYYISIYHRSSIETWSSSAILLGGVTDYDFTSSMLSAYGDGYNAPMRSMGGGVFAIYGGDLNHDGTVDIYDESIADNDATAFFYGYNDDCSLIGNPGVPPTFCDSNTADCNGDGAADINDMRIIENNMNLIIYFARPY